MGFQYWVGMDMDPAVGSDELAESNRFYSEVHVREVVAANAGFTGSARYELLDAGNAGSGPRFLATYELQDEAAASAYMALERRPEYSEWPPARQHATIVWRILWREISSAGTRAGPVGSIFVVGMNIPPETNDKQLQEFNAFYTNIHVPEVMAAGGYSSGTRFELHHAFTPGVPRFCAVYEADARATQDREQRRAKRAPLSSGPATWEQHDTLWRLVYKRL